jgi:hypothetical protein
MYLIDTGADVSVFPRSCLRETTRKSTYQLAAANGALIDTYGRVTLRPNFGLRREFVWPFIVADVDKPIIGADFIYHFGLLVDLRKKCLVDGNTKLCANGLIIECETPSVKSIIGVSPYHALLTEFAQITRPRWGQGSTAIHNTVHHIVTTPGPPTAQRPRRLAPDKLQAAKKDIAVMLQNGMARPSKSPWASPLHLVPKTADEWRPCGDYRALNARTLPDRYPVRHIQDFAHALHGKQLFSTIDLVKAFHQIPLAEDSIPKTAITTPFGLFEFTVMTFGLRNAAQTFQRFIDEVLHGLDFCYAYIDDILVASSTEEEHQQHLRILFERLSQYGVVLNSSKCVFGAREVKFLGYLVSSTGISPLPNKVAAIREFSRPTTVKQLRQYLGMLNFYRRFLPGAADILAPLNDLLHGNVKGKQPIPWSQAAIVSFDKSKEVLAQAALLRHPDPNAPLAIFCDASDVAIGAVLQQEVEGNWEPLEFFSRKLNQAETKYSAYDRELLAMYSAVKHFRHMVEAREFAIYTDHKPLTYAFLQKTQPSTPRQARHFDYVGQFTTDIRHIAGVDNVVADVLSRVEEIVEAINYEDLAEAQRTDSELQQMKSSNTNLQLKLVAFPGSSSSVVCDVSGQTARPFLTPSFRRTAFDLIHNLSHPGIKASVKAVSARFVWPSIKTDCRKWAQECLRCQQAKVSRHVSAPISQFKFLSGRFEHLHIDIVIMPPSEGYRYCLTMVDRFTRWPEAIPLQNQEAPTVARALYEHWITRFGTPRRITSDQGRQFESYLFKALNALIGSTHLRTTAYHPQSNGAVERIHRQLKAALMCHQNSTWTKALPTVLLGMRTSLKEDLQATSAEMLYGQSLRLPGEFFGDKPTIHDAGSEFVQNLRVHMRQFQPTEVSRHGTKRTFVHERLRDCSHVFVRDDAVRQGLQPPYNGPFRVISRSDKLFVLQINEKVVTVSIDRVKPAFTCEEANYTDVPNANEYFSTYQQQMGFSTPANASDHIPPHLPSPSPPSSPPSQPRKVSFAQPPRRSTRKSIAPKFYQAGR